MGKSFVLPYIQDLTAGCIMDLTGGKKYEISKDVPNL